MTVNELIFEINHTYNLNKFQKTLIITYIKEQDKKIEDLQKDLAKKMEIINKLREEKENNNE